MFVRYRIFFCHCRSDHFVRTGEEGRHITHHGKAQEQVSAGSLFHCLILAWDHMGKDLAEQREAILVLGRCSSANAGKSGTPPVSDLPCQQLVGCSLQHLSLGLVEVEGRHPSGPSPSGQNLLPPQPVPDQCQAVSHGSQWSRQMLAGPGLMMCL